MMHKSQSAITQIKNTKLKPTQNKPKQQRRQIKSKPWQSVRKIHQIQTLTQSNHKTPLNQFLFNNHYKITSDTLHTC